ncbi:MAG: beta-galactosidase [Verrucomicrobiae bacterium]|nr:beta-galactosidase [Verrucomicrobiae bacterium]
MKGFCWLVAVPLVLGSATLANSNGLGWGAEPVEELSTTRGRICLNGVWEFLPAEGPAVREPVGQWGLIPVPGAWNNHGAFPPIISRGSGEAWNNFDGNAARVWYRRMLHIPAAWAGRAILLDVRRVSTDATVYVNGIECGTIPWPAGTVDITRAVQAGKTATLLMKVVAVDNEKEVLQFMGHDQITVQKAKLDARGLIGEVFLLSRPRGPHVADVFVQTSTRRQELALDVELAGVTQPGKVQLVAQMLDERGQEEKRFEAEAEARPEQPRLRVAWSWPDPRLWDVGQPNLYTLRLQVRGAGINDEYTQEFGFREFWIEGKKFFLNGSEIRLRPVMVPHEEWSTLGGNVAGIDGVIAGLMSAGFNFGEHWPFDHDRRGRVHFRELWAERASRAGFLLAGCALRMNGYISGPNWTVRTWDEDDNRERYLARMSDELRRYRNYPAIVMWVTSGNFFGHSLDQDPRYIGMTGYSANNEFRLRAQVGQEGCAMIKSVDPTRPVMTHHGSYVGDVHTVNMYLNFIPLQEREEWLSHWAKHGELPFMPVEFGTPLHCSFMRGRAGFAHAVTSEPLMTEFSAIYLGPEAYRLETSDYRREIRARFESGQKYENWQGNVALEGAPAFQEIQRLFIQNTWRSWRTWGITGGMIPWAMAHGWHDGALGREEVPAPPRQPGHRGTHREKLRKGHLFYLRPEGTAEIRPAAHALLGNNRATLAWIAGPAEAFTAKDHNFAAGSTVRKQIVLLNDDRVPRAYDVEWAVEVGGEVVARGADHGTLSVAETRFVPLTFTLPKRIGTDKVEGRIRLNGTIGGQRHTDAFAFRVFAPMPKSKGKLAVFDPLGETTAMLRMLGYEVEPVSAKSKVIVIGRKALSERHELPFALDSVLQQGARVIVMGQDPRWMQHALGLRTAPFPARRVFRVQATHPVVAGLDDEDLRDWAAVSTWVEPYPHWQGFEDLPTYGWRWGNRGAVSSAPIEKPHRGGWRPILECEFDLAYTPLMELDYGAGRLVMCTLDLEDQARSDPAARRLARQLFEYLRNAPIPPKAAAVVFTGGEDDARMLEFLGVDFHRGDVPPTSGLWVLGTTANPSATEVDEFLQKGGKVLYLIREQDRERVQNFAGSLNPPAWPECAGLSASDLRWRTTFVGLLLKPVAGLEIGADGLLGRRSVGKGVAMYCQIDPNYLPADELTYFRYTRWRQTRALSQILANLGATFRQDRRFVELVQDPEHPVFLDGIWEVQLTQRFEESLKRVWNRDPGMSERAAALVQPDCADAQWELRPVPALMESYGGPWATADGEAVFRKVVELPAAWAGRDLYLSIGRVDESDITFFNGEEIGRTKNWEATRGYVVPGRLVQPGRNVIAVRAYDEGVCGGLIGPPERLYLVLRSDDKEFYHPDYLDDHKLGDNPYRYYRW